LFGASAFYELTGVRYIDTLKKYIDTLKMEPNTLKKKFSFFDHQFFLSRDFVQNTPKRYYNTLKRYNLALKRKTMGKSQFKKKNFITVQF
jgi:hypothetical protein